jgi:hypothetical protein
MGEASERKPEGAGGEQPSPKDQEIVIVSNQALYYTSGPEKSDIKKTVDAFMTGHVDPFGKIDEVLTKETSTNRYVEGSEILKTHKGRTSTSDSKPSDENTQESTEHPSANKSERGKESAEHSDQGQERKPWTAAERAVHDYNKDVTYRALDRVAEVAENGLKEHAQTLDGPGRQDLVDLVQGILVNADLTRERLSRLLEEGGDFEGVAAQLTFYYQYALDEIDRLSMRLEELATADKEDAGKPAARGWLRSLSELVGKVLRQVVKFLSEMMKPKEWTLKCKLGSFLAGGEIEIKFDR